MSRPRTVAELRDHYDRGPGLDEAVAWARAALERGEPISEVVEGSGLSIATLESQLGELLKAADRRRAS